jgi:Ca-activated chloride channel family protein
MGMALALLVTGWADGLIVVRDPDALSHPILPPPRPRPPHWMPPPVRSYVFAPLEVSYHHVKVRIADPIAVTSVDQEFYNPNPRQLEGTYLFPVPPGAQIDKFTMEINGKPVEAELLAADKARKIYEDIVRTLKDPALLEYAGRDVFKVRIFPIEPNSRKRVTLSYTQVLKTDDGLVNYVYPLNTEKFSAKPIKSVTIKIELEGKRPLKSIYSPSHNLDVLREGANRATVRFESRDVRPDTDFQLLYSLEADPIGVNLMTYKKPSEDGYFLWLASPGFDVKGSKLVRKDIAFILDTSGSMAGAKLNQARKALEFCVENLNEGDRFEIIRFSTETEPLFNRLTEVTEPNLTRARQFIKELKPLGGTAIDAALRAALALQPAKSDRPYMIIFLTDGRPTLGVTDENQILAGVRRGTQTNPDREGNAGPGNPRIFCFGIGSDVNTHLLDKITEATRAYSQYVLPEEDLEVKVSNFYSKIKAPVLANLKIVFPEGVRVTKLYPSSLPDLFRGEQLVLVGRYAHAGTGSIRLEGTVNGERREFRYAVNFREEAGDHEFIPRLWATRRVGYLLDEIRLRGENAELKDEVTELARQYGIVTPYTAYLIVEDEAKRNVPAMSRSMQSFDRDAGAQQEAANAWRSYQTSKSGDSAVAGARYGMALKSATSPAAGIGLGNREASRGMALASPAPTVAMAPAASRPGQSPVLPAPAPVTAVERVVQYAQQAQYVNGKNFFQNGNQWIDAAVQKATQAKKVRIQFNSPEYFRLAARESKALPWLALGQNVQFVLNGTVYEVYE